MTAVFLGEKNPPVSSSLPMASNPIIVAFFAIFSAFAFLSALFSVSRTFERPHSLADTVKMYEMSRGPSTHGMPGFYGAARGTCLAETADVLGDAYVGSIVKDAASSPDSRDRAMVYILRSAIADTPDGDVVDFGGSSEVLFLRVLREMDLCGRRLWAIPGDFCKSQQTHWNVSTVSSTFTTNPTHCLAGVYKIHRFHQPDAGCVSSACRALHGRQLHISSDTHDIDAADRRGSLRQRRHAADGLLQPHPDWRICVCGQLPPVTETQVGGGQLPIRRQDLRPDVAHRGGDAGRCEAASPRGVVAEDRLVSRSWCVKL